MNRSKRPMPAKLRKQMSKEVHLATSSYPAPEDRQYEDELTAKEMLKKFPKKPDKKKAALLQSIEKAIAAKLKKPTKGISKRTSPGLPPRDSSPAYPHREGKRWIKNLTKQTSSERTIQSHRGSQKK